MLVLCSASVIWKSHDFQSWGDGLQIRYARVGTIWTHVGKEQIGTDERYDILGNMQLDRSKFGIACMVLVPDLRQRA